MKSESPSSFAIWTNTSGAQSAAAVFESQCSCSIWNEDILVQRRKREVDGAQRGADHICLNGQLSMDLAGCIALVKCQDEFLEFSGWLLNPWSKVWNPSFFLKDTITLSNFRFKMPTSLLHFHKSTNHDLLFSGKCRPDYVSGGKKFCLLDYKRKAHVFILVSCIFSENRSKHVYRPSLTWTSCPCPFQGHETSDYWRWPACSTASHFELERDSSQGSRLCSNSSFHKNTH